MSIDWIPIAWAVGAFILVLTPIILVHELGHFVTARYFNIRVEEFGLGFPPRAAKLFTQKGTLFSLNWIPLGGFVRPAGEDDPNVPGGLAGAPKLARFVVLSGGAVANFILAFFVFWAALIIGPRAIAVAEVAPGSPADTAGLQPGDQFLRINGDYADSLNGLRDVFARGAGEEVSLLIMRDSQEMVLTLIPRVEGEYDPAVEGPIGVLLDFPTDSVRLQRGPGEAFGDAFDSIWNVVSLTVRAPAMLIAGELKPEEVRPLSPVAISQITGMAAESTAQTGDWFPLLNLVAVINVALGFTNLLPLPALDGGRLLFVIIEAVRGRRVEPEREGMVHMVGMLFLLGLTAILIFQDLFNPLEFLAN